MKRLLALVGVLVAACLVTVGVVQYEVKQEQIRNSDEIILQIPADTVTALAWENETEALSFHKDGTWLYDGDEAFPVDEEAIGELLSLFESFGVSFVIEDVEDYGQYGLDDPVCTIRITTTEQLEDVKTAEELAAEATPEPTDAEATEEPTDAEATEEPTDAETTEELSDAETTEEPTDAEATEEPTDAEATEEPTDAETTEEPTDAEATEEPTDAEATEEPTDAETTEEPTDAETTAAPQEGGADGYTYEIRLGDFSVMDEQRYVSIGDGRVYLVSNDPLDWYDAGLSDMIDHDEIPAFDQVTAIRFAGTEDYDIRYEEESADTYCPDDVYFAQLDGESRPLDTGRVDDYLSALSALQLTDYVNYKVTEEELSEYGLDATELTVTVTYTVAADDDTEEDVTGTLTLQLSRNAAQVQAAEEAAQQAEADGDTDYEAEEIPAYARVGESPIVYKITTSSFKTLMAAAYDDLRHTEAFTADFAMAYQADLSLEGEAYVLARAEADEETGDDADEAAWYYGETEVDISGFESALTALNAETFTAETPDGLEEIGLTIYLDNDNHPQVTLELYRYDGSSCLAVVDGEPFALLPRSQVVDLIEAVHAIVLEKS